MKNTDPNRLHATCISIDGAGILIRGSSGAGKSDLALRLISEGALLVADDQVNLHTKNGNLIACAPDSLDGLLEVRGIGIIRMSSQASTSIRLVIDLNDYKKIERIPEVKITELEGINLPKIDLWAFEISAVTKVQIALDLALSRINRIHE